MRKTTRITFAITVICMALAGCGNATADTPDVMPATSAQCTETHTDGIGKVGRMVRSQECEITLKDTRKLDCVRLGDGLSCDWDHVSGADKEPER